MEKMYLYWIIGLIISLIVIGTVVMIALRGDEDSWIRDSNGLWVKHGNPSKTPDGVALQREALICAKGLYTKELDSGAIFNSQCLGSCQNYSIDIVNVPRNSDDDKPENQCSDYSSLKTNKFIEFDKEGNIVRIVD